MAYLLLVAILAYLVLCGWLVRQALTITIDSASTDDIRTMEEHCITRRR